MCQIRFYVLFTLVLNAKCLISVRNLRVVTLYHEPFVMPPSEEGEIGPQGLLVDLISEIAARTRTKIDFRIVKDAVYGHVTPNGTWNGLIGHLIANQADVALAALTITPGRNKVVKFGYPFITTGIVGLGKRSSFPFYDENIDSLLEKAEKGEIILGALQGGSTENFFRDSSVPLYAKVDQEIQKHPEGFVYSYDEAIDKVRSADNVDYVFFGEQFILEHAASQTPCDLRVITSDPLNLINYAMAFALNVSDKIFNEFNDALLDMQMFGNVKMLKRKWNNVQCKRVDYNKLCSNVKGEFVSDQPRAPLIKNIDKEDYENFTGNSYSNYSVNRSFTFFNLSGHHFKLHANLSEE